MLGLLHRRMLPVFVALLAIGAAHGVDVALSVDQGAPVAGTTITVTVTLNNAAPFENWGCQVDFPAGNLQLVGIAAGSFATFVPDARSFAQINASHEIHLGGYGMGDNGGGTGTLAVLQFLVLNGATSSLTTVGADAAHPFGDTLFDHTLASVVPVSDAALVITARNPDVVSLNTGLTLNATESGSPNGNFTVQRQNNVGTVIVPLAIGGTAVPGVDYAPLPSQATILPGQFSVAIPIHGLNNAAMLGSQTITIDLLPSSSYSLTTRSGSALLLDDLGPSTLLSVDRTTVAVGQTLTVTLSIANAPVFHEWGELIRAPPGMLHLLSQDAGDFSTQVADARPIAVINASGEVHAGGHGVNSGGGRLGVFTFLVMQPGSILLTAPAQGAGEPFGLALFDHNEQLLIPQAAPAVTVTSLPAEVVTISSTQPTASEVGPTPASITVSRNRSTDALTVSLLSGGSSTPAMWGAIPSSVVFAIGQSTLTFPVVPVVDHIVEGTRTLVMTVGSGNLYSVGSPSAVTITRLDADGADLSLAASTTRPQLNSTVVITMHLDQGPAFSQFGGILRFPVGKLSLQGQVAGAANFGTFVPDARPGATIDASGEVRVGSYSSNDQSGGSGDLVALSFKVLASGPITLTTVDQAGGAPFGDDLMTASGLPQLPTIANVLTLQVAPDTAPTAIQLSSTHVRQALPVGTLVGVLSDTDADVGDYATYALVSGTGSSDNAKFTISGNELLTATVFDVSLTPSCSIRVRATDSGALFVEAPFTITIDAGGAVIYVSRGATGANTGTSWANAYTDLAPALASAVSGNQVWVSAGTYQPTASTDTTRTLTIGAGVAVYGGFLGTEPTLVRSWAAHPTTLSGLIGGGLHARHVVTLTPGGSLDGVVVSGGDASNLLGDQSGGGVLVPTGASTALLSHCVITGNHAAASGGGVCSLGGATVIENCVLDSDTADNGAGAFAAGSGTHLMSEDTLTNDAGLSAGAAATTGSAGLTAIDCLFDNDSVPALLGGSSVDLVVSSCCLGPGATSSVITLGGDIALDPLLVDALSPSGGDGIWFSADDGIQLSAVSPCRLAGVNAGLPDDLVGAPRPTGASAVDIGAYQFQITGGQAPVITNSLLASGMVGVPFSVVLSASGTAPVAFTAAPLPAGLVLGGGVISGTPLAEGTTTVTLNAANGVGSAVPVLLVVTITAAGNVPPVITNALTATAYLGVPFAFPITASGTAPITIGASPLPQGLSLFGGTIQGTPTALGTTDIDLSAANASGIAPDEVLVLSVVAPVPPTITSPLTAGAVVNQFFAYTITTSGTAPVSVGASPLPAGLTLSGNVISGTPTLAGPTTVTLTATNIAGSAAPQSLVLTVSTPASITSALTASGTVGSAFTYTPTASGSTPITFTAAPLPAGLSFDGTTISGTPTSAATTVVVVTATNPAGPTSVNLTITITAVAAPVFTSADTAYGTVGAAFPFVLTASGATPIAFTTPDPLPVGLTLNSDGSFSGVPTTAGTSVMVVTATNAGGSIQQTLTLIMQTPALITSALSASGLTGSSFSYTITASGSTPLTYTASGLPAGLTLSGNLISGTPAAAATTAVTITAANGVHTDSQTLTITITAPLSPVFTSPPLLTAATGAGVDFALTASGTAPITFTIQSGTLPTGLSLSGGVISGSSSVVGTTIVTILATNSAGFITQDLQVVIQDPPVITSAVSDSGTVGTPYSYTITASGTTPLTFDAQNLPAGLSLNNDVISGIPLAAGETIIDLSASNQVAIGTGSLDLVIADAIAPAFTTATAVTAEVGVALSFSCGASGSLPITFSTASALPAGVSFSSAGALTGIPTLAGIYPLTLTASNAGGSIQQVLTVTVQDPALISSPLTASGTVGAPFTYTMTATGSQPIALTASNLPAGLTVSAGVISGTPTSAGTTLVALSASNLVHTDAPILTITIAAATLPVFTSANALAATASQPFSFIFAASGTQPITYTTSTLPSGLTLSADTISGSGITAVGVYPITVTATNGAGPATQVWTLTVQIPPAITSALTDSATVGTPYSYTITASGTAPLTFTASSLPAGLSLAAGVISGTPSAPGSFPITITAGNLVHTDSQLLTLTVVPATVPVFTSLDNAAFATGSAFSFTLAASGSLPMTFATGALPGTLTLSGGVISGTVATAGVYPVTVTATNAAGTTPQTLTLTVQDPPAITSALSIGGTVGTPFSYVLTASGSTPLGFTATPLPPGLSLLNGVISGIPSSAGITNVAIAASNLVGTDGQTLVITIVNASAPVFTSSTSAIAEVNHPFSFTITASGSLPIVFTTSALPPWLTLTADTLSGTPPSPGVFPITITATNAGGSPTQVLTVTALTPPLITSALAAGATVGVPFSYTITATGSTPLTFTASPLPAGLTLSGAVVSGTPSAPGTTDVAITATNAIGSDPQTLVVTVAAAVAPVITSAASAAIQTASPFSLTLTASGTAPITFSTSALPSGLTLSAGIISGAPTTPGVYPVTVTALNGGGSVQQTLTLTVQDPPLVTSALAVAGQVGVPFSYAILSGGTGPFVDSAAPLPAGLTLSGNLITGTPSAVGVTTVVVAAANLVNSASASVVVTITPGPTPTITSALSANATTNQAFSYDVTTSGPGPITISTSPLPAGLSLNAATISGTPVTSGVSAITLSATNANGTSQQTLTLTVLSAPVVVSALTAHGVVGAPFSYTIIAGGSTPMSFATSALPSGLTLTGNVISGIPGSAGTTNVVLTVVNSVGSATPTLQLTISPSTAPVITSGATLTGIVGSKLTYDITATGSGPISYGASPLPPGMVLVGSHLSGAPSAAGTTLTTLTASNAGGAATPLILTITIAPAVAPVITSADSASGSVGAAFAYTITASGSQPISFGALPLPAGLVRSGQTIHGTPSAAGTTAITVTATNAAGSAVPLVLTVTILPPAPPVITSPTQAQGTVGIPFSYLITAAGVGPISFTTSALPPGLTRNGATISGTPTLSGGTAVVITATDGDLATAVATVTMTMLPQQLPVITSALTASAAVGVPFSYTITANGATPITFAAVTLPPGLTLSGALISGIPTTPGVTSVQVSGTNVQGTGAAVTLTVTVAPGVAPLITSPDSAVFVVGTPVTFPVSAIGSGTIVFTSTALPAGLTLSGSTISGIPLAVYSGPAVTLTATSLVGATTQQLSLSVVAPAAPLITSPVSASGVVGTPFRWTITASGSPNLTVTTSTLPAGLTLSAGVISGVPLAAGQTVVQVTVSNPVGSDLEPLLITITDAIAPLFTSPPTANGLVGAPFSFQLTASGSQPITITASGLPAGLSLTGDTISGTPLAPGVVAVALLATNAGGQASGVLTISVTAATAPSFTSAASATGIAGSAFSLLVSATGSQPLQFSSLDLPAGFTLSPGASFAGGTTQATLSGVLPTAAGVVTIDLLASNAAGSTAQAFLLTVLPAAPQIVSFNPPGAGVAGGALVTISGANLQNTTSVTVGGLAASVLSTSPGSVVVAIPAHAAGFVTATLTTSSGVCVSPGYFGYVPLPTLVTIAPATGSTLGGETITITGTQLDGLPGLSSVLGITFDGLPATLSVISGTSLVLTVPAHPAGAVDVVVTTLAGTFTLAHAFTYAAPASASGGPDGGIASGKPESTSASKCGLGGGGLSLLLATALWRRRRR